MPALPDHIEIPITEIAEQLRIPVVEEDLQPYDVYTADEAFFCSTPFNLLPVSMVDKRIIGDGQVPGPVTSQLLAAWSEQVGVDIVDCCTKRSFARRD